MKRILFFLLLALLFSHSTNASLIEVKIPKDLKGNVSSFFYNYSLDILNFNVEFYNTGSVPYKARIRADVFEDSEIIFTAWSKEKTLMPGERKNFKTYWYTNSTGNFTVRIRSYFASEIFEKSFRIEKKTQSLPDDVFEIKNFRAYDSFVVFDIESKKDAKNVVIIPSEFPVGWIFEQEKIDYIRENGKRSVLLHFQPTVWTEESLTLVVASDEGKYSSKRTFELKKETGLLGFINFIIDMIKILWFR